MKFFKDGKIVVLLQGRYAGKKALILKTMDDNTKERPYGHCVVVGVAKSPLPITKAMCKPTPRMKKIVKKRSTVKPFVKMVNFTHVMPTRSLPMPIPSFSHLHTSIGSYNCEISTVSVRDSLVSTGTASSPP